MPNYASDCLGETIDGETIDGQTTDGQTTMKRSPIPHYAFGVFTRRAAVLLTSGLLVSACGAEGSSTTSTLRTKNAAISVTRSTIIGSSCSPLGAVYRTKPVIVPPPEQNAAEQGYTSSNECSFYDEYRTFPGIGRYEFIWDAAKTSSSTSGRPVVVEVSRDGITWTSLDTEWSPKRPHTAVAYLTMAGELRVRVHRQ
jgi:hypothetical protein